MSRALYKVSANVMFLFHCCVLLVIVFGWLAPSIWPFYMALLGVTLVLDIILGYCILSKWEFVLRKKVNPHLDYDYSFSSYYLERLAGKRISEHFVSRVGSFFLVASLAINLFFHVAR